MSDKHGPDKHGRILIIETLIDDTKFILINLFNANTENNQLTTFSKQTNMFENLFLLKIRRWFLLLFTSIFASIYL